MGDRPAAERACKEPNPIIDGRKANVNLAILGAKPRGNLQPGKIRPYIVYKYIYTISIAINDDNNVPGDTVRIIQFEIVTAHQSRTQFVLVRSCVQWRLFSDDVFELPKGVTISCVTRTKR